jgi:hypothetical protein
MFETSLLPVGERDMLLRLCGLLAEVDIQNDTNTDLNGKKMVRFCIVATRKQIHFFGTFWVNASWNADRFMRQIGKFHESLAVQDTLQPYSG